MQEIPILQAIKTEPLYKLLYLLLVKKHDWTGFERHASMCSGQISNVKINAQKECSEKINGVSLQFLLA